jgi:hypothetical protein
MRRREDPVQGKAHRLLDEWAQGPVEAAHDDRIAERVDGGERPLSEPERYALAQGRYESLDRAVRHVYRMDIRLGAAIWAYYAERMSDSDCAARAGDSRRKWRDRLKTARAAFLAAYEMSRATGEGVDTDCVHSLGY